MIDALNSSMARLVADTTSGNELAARSRYAEDDAALRGVAQEFEALFLKQMLGSMRSTLKPENDMLHGGLSQDIFEDMLYDEYSRVMAKTGSIGIADLIYDQLK
jgi:peptidoglycan hydrolase FlgJ